VVLQQVCCTEFERNQSGGFGAVITGRMGITKLIGGLKTCFVLRRNIHAAFPLMDHTLAIDTPRVCHCRAEDSIQTLANI
jgi:hypothetical protein